MNTNFHTFVVSILDRYGNVLESEEFKTIPQVEHFIFHHIDDDFDVFVKGLTLPFFKHRSPLYSHYLFFYPQFCITGIVTPDFPFIVLNHYMSYCTEFTSVFNDLEVKEVLLECYQ